MSSLQGTDQAYDQIAGNYLYLSLSSGDTIWGTDFAKIGDIEPLQGGVNYQNLVRSMKIVDGEENNANILKRYIQANQNATKSLENLTSSSTLPVPTIYHLLSSFPECSRIKQVIDSVGYSSLLNQVTEQGDLTQKRFTFFAPVNSAVDQALNTWLKTPAEVFTPQPYNYKYTISQNGLPNREMAQLLKAHTLSFNLQIKDTFERKLELYTLLDHFSFVIDGTSRVVPYLNVYQNPLYLKNYQYPTGIDRFKVLKYFEAENGSLYIIDNILTPQIIV